MKDEEFKQKVVQQVLENQEKNRGEDPFKLFSDNPFTVPVDMTDCPCPRCGGEMEGSRMLGSLLGGVVRCTKCSYKDGLTSYALKTAFTVQPMPEGAKLIYMEKTNDDE